MAKVCLFEFQKPFEKSFGMQLSVADESADDYVVLSKEDAILLLEMINSSAQAGYKLKIGKPSKQE